jgi:hypothetical protein
VRIVIERQEADMTILDAQCCNCTIIDPHFVVMIDIECKQPARNRTDGSPMRTNNDSIVWCVPTNDFLDCSNRAELQVRVGFATDVDGGAGILSVGGIVAWVRSAYLGDGQMFP